MRVLFISDHIREYPSTICMALEPIEYLNRNGINASFLEEKEVLGNEDSAFQDLDIVVFVKACNVQLLKKAYNQNIKTVWYADESLMSEYETMLNNKHYLHSIISTCEPYTDKCKSLGFVSQKFQTVYHHHCNFLNETPDFNSEVKNVGFIGMDDQLHRKEDFRTFLNTYNCKLITNQSAAAFKIDLFSTLRTLDLGLIFLDKDKDEGLAGFEKTWGDRMKYRSNTKISNFIAFGIPSVVVPYNSYVELLKDKAGCCFFVNNFDEACSSLKTLIENQYVRKGMRDTCLQYRNELHLNSTVKDFIKLFNDLLE